ncbi:MAG: rod shape-determining protein MreD [Rhodospirillales bacterium]
MSNIVSIKVEAAARAAVPAGMTVALMLLGSIPATGMHAQFLEPVLAFASIYYWTLYRPDLMPAPLVFALGLLYDVISGAPVGTHAAMLALAHAILSGSAASSSTRPSSSTGPVLPSSPPGPASWSGC